MEMDDGIDEQFVQASAVILNLLESNTDKDEMNGTARRRSRPGNRANLEANFKQTKITRHRNYFTDVLMYEPESFPRIRRRYRIWRDIFEKVYTSVISHAPYFTRKKKRCRKSGIDSRVKVNTYRRVLGYGLTPY